MRYSASEKLEIIRLVEQSHLPVRRTLGQIGIPRSTFYRWYDLYQTGGPEALDDHSPRPDRVWNRIPDDIRSRIVTLALDEPELSPRELAVRFTDAERYFVSEASVYRLLKAHDLITSPAFIAMKAADEFKDKTTAPNQLWQTDFTYLKVIGWGWFYLSTILDDFSRYIIAWKLCTTMKAEDVTDTLELALQASGCDQAKVVHRPRLLSDNGSSYVSGDLAKWLERQDMRHIAGAPYHPHDAGQDRALASDAQEPHPARELLSARRSRSADRGLRRSLQPSALPREHRQSHPGRRLLRARPDHPAGTRKDQTTDHPKSTLASPQTSRITSTRCARTSLGLGRSCLKNSDDGQCVCPRGCRMPTITNRTSWRGHCSRLRLRDVYVSCSINSTILLIPMRWFAARRSARLISCRPAQCLGHELKTVFLQNLPILRKIW